MRFRVCAMPGRQRPIGSGRSGYIPLIYLMFVVKTNGFPRRAVLLDIEQRRGYKEVNLVVKSPF
jgi:hypothetical protein